MPFGLDRQRRPRTRASRRVARVRRRGDRRSPRRQDARVPVAPADGSMADRRRRSAGRRHAWPLRSRSIPIVVAAVLTGAGSGIVAGTLLATRRRPGRLRVRVHAVRRLAETLHRVGARLHPDLGGLHRPGRCRCRRVALRKYTRSILVDRTGADLDLADFSLAIGVDRPVRGRPAALAVAAWRLANQDID